MSSSLERLKALSSKLEEKNKAKQGLLFADDASVEETVIINAENDRNGDEKQEESGAIVRIQNMERLKLLFDKLGIAEKSPEFDKVFNYKAMNLSGIGLKDEDFGEVREGKYIQIIAITYEPDKNGKKKAKNISLGYFGKAGALSDELKKEIIEFVLRWRYEKAFQNLEHYKDLIAKIDEIPEDSPQS